MTSDFIYYQTALKQRQLVIAIDARDEVICHEVFKMTGGNRSILGDLLHCNDVLHIILSDFRLVSITSSDYDSLLT